MFTKGLMEFGNALVNITLVDIKPSLPLLEDSYLEDSIQIATYLQTLQQLERVDQKAFQVFKKKALWFIIQDY